MNSINGDGVCKYKGNSIEAVVTDDLILASNEEINAAMPDSITGMIIYNANGSIMKQKEHDGKWTTIFRGVTPSLLNSLNAEARDTE